MMFITKDICGLIYNSLKIIDYDEQTNMALLGSHE